MIDLNNVQLINLSQFFDSVKFRSGSGSEYHLAIDFCIVMFYMLMILMKGRTRINMVWVPPLGFDPYCEGKWLPLQDRFTPSINSE